MEPKAVAKQLIEDILEGKFVGLYTGIPPDSPGWVKISISLVPFKYGTPEHQIVKDQFRELLKLGIVQVLDGPPDWLLTYSSDPENRIEKLEQLRRIINEL